MNNEKRSSVSLQNGEPPQEQFDEEIMRNMDTIKCLALLYLEKLMR